jgi:hypothetical protein
MLGSAFTDSFDFTHWAWWVSQFFSFLLLVCLIVSMQQKTRKKLMWWNTTGMLFGLIGSFFLSHANATVGTAVIILMAVNFSRNTTVLVFSYFPNAKRKVFWPFGGALIAAVVIANIIFWKGPLLGLMGIAIGIGFIIAFWQTTPKGMRYGLAMMRFPALAFSILTTNLVQGVTEMVAFTSGVIAIIRLDIKKKNAEEITPCACVKECACIAEKEDGDTNPLRFNP